MADLDRMTVELPDVIAAGARIAPLVDPGPLIRSLPLSRALKGDVWLKVESLHPPGSFKVRGAANKLLLLNESERRAGVVASSAGNHGAAVGHVAQRLGIPATICVPLSVSPVKLEAIRRSGAEAVVSGSTFDEAVEVSRTIQRELGLVYVDPFDDPEVIAGQGTIGLEILEALPDVDLVVAAVSGGGLIGGLGVALEPARPKVRIVGASAERAAAMAASIRAGRPVDVPEEPTLAEVLSGGIGPDNRYTLSLVQRHVDEHVLVSEEEIAEAMRFAMREHRLVVEGGGAVAMAAALAAKLPTARTVAVVVSGGNVDPAQLCGLVGA